MPLIFELGKLGMQGAYAVRIRYGEFIDQGNTQLSNFFQNSIQLFFFS